jgi:hypothetical protein
MEVARDLIRDLVGILFPGGLLVTLTLWAFWAVTAPFSPLASSSISPTDKSIIILLILTALCSWVFRFDVDLQSSLAASAAFEFSRGFQPR